MAVFCVLLLIFSPILLKLKRSVSFLIIDFGTKNNVNTVFLGQLLGAGEKNPISRAITEVADCEREPWMSFGERGREV